MLTIHLSDITVLPHRQRREFDENSLRELGESIEKHGLFNALVVRPPREGESIKTPWVLVQGERRLRAIEDWLWGMNGELRHGIQAYSQGYVPCVQLSSLDPLQAEEAEFEENFRREDLTWQEEAAALSRLANLRLRQAQAVGADTPTTADLALEVRGSAQGIHQDIVRQNLIVAKHLADPEVAKQSNLTEAFKFLKRREETRRNIQRAEDVGVTYSSAVHRLFNEECVQWMQKQEPNQFDVILTDPPYGIDAQDFGDAGGRLQRQTHEYDDSFASWNLLMEKCSVEWFRIAKPMAHIYVCCDVDNFFYLKSMMASAGWEVHRTPIINYKRDGNRVPWPEHGPQRKWEMILYAIKGKKPTLRIFPDVVETYGDPNLSYGAQKPVALFVDLLRRSAVAGDAVLDTFCGTGTIFPAAQALLLRATGVEIDSNGYGIAYKRLKELE